MTHRAVKPKTAPSIGPFRKSIVEMPHQNSVTAYHAKRKIVFLQIRTDDQYATAELSLEEAMQVATALITVVAGRVGYEL